MLLGVARHLAGRQPPVAATLDCVELAVVDLRLQRLRREAESGCGLLDGQSFHPLRASIVAGLSRSGARSRLAMTRIIVSLEPDFRQDDARGAFGALSVKVIVFMAIL